MTTSKLLRVAAVTVNNRVVMADPLAEYASYGNDVEKSHVAPKAQGKITFVILSIFYFCCHFLMRAELAIGSAEAPLKPIAVDTSGVAVMEG